jgi:hypothetical protein
MSELPFKIVKLNGRDVIIATAELLLVAQVAFERTAELYPHDIVELRQGARVIAKSEARPR